VLEIGAGCGLMALGFIRAFPDSVYVICDVPEVLTVSFAYLNLALPNHRHIMVLPDGPVDATNGLSVQLAGLSGAFVYVPNFMMHRYSSSFELDMAVNAMSLHEMRP